MSKKTKIIERILAVIVAVLFLQTLFFKFSASPESVEVFSKLGVEPWGRIVTGILELLAAIMLLVPKFAKKGAILAGIIMVGAVASHVFVLGYTGEQAVLAAMAVALLIASVIIYKLRSKINK